MKNRAVIVNAVRTPVGKMRQSLAGVPAMTLAAEVIKASIQKAGIDPSKVDEVLFSNLMNNDNGWRRTCRWRCRALPLNGGAPAP